MTTLDDPKHFGASRDVWTLWIWGPVLRECGIDVHDDKTGLQVLLAGIMGYRLLDPSAPFESLFMFVIETFAACGGRYLVAQKSDRHTDLIVFYHE